MKNKIIAEIGSVHDGKIDLAFKLINEAAKCGADIVKFQMHIAEEESLKNAPNPNYFNSEDRYSYFKRTSFKMSEWLKIKRCCEYNNVEFLCSPFSIKAVENLQKLKVNHYKVPSGEVTNLPLLEKLKKTKKHIIISTGMSNFKEIKNAVRIFKEKKLTILQCSSIYPCPVEKVGINLIDELRKKFKCSVGFSDHTIGFAASYAAAALGANIIEKHFTLSKKMYGSDAKNSMEPNDFKVFSKTIKEIWKLNSFKLDKNDISDFKNMKFVFEKSIYAKKKLDINSIIQFKDLSFKKPNNFLRADKYKILLGKKLKVSKKKNEPITLDDIKK